MKRNLWPASLVLMAVLLGGCTAKASGQFSQGPMVSPPPVVRTPAPQAKPAPVEKSTTPAPTNTGTASTSAASAPAPNPAQPPAASTKSSGSASAGKGGEVPVKAPAPAPAVDPNKLAVDQRLAVTGGEFVLTAVQDGQRWAGLKSAKGVTAWATATVPSDSAVTVSLQKGLVLVESQKAGAPQYTAFQTSAAGLTPVNWYERIAPKPEVTQGPFILVDKYLNALWYYQDGKLQKAYRVATGRQTDGPLPNAQNYKANYFTPEGQYRVTNYIKNPAYYTLNNGEHNYKGGEPDNPLGTRWMGFSVFSGDGANIWGIHGTSHPEQMGMWVSDGCIRMYTSQVEELFGLLAGRPAVLKVVHGQ